MEIIEKISMVIDIDLDVHIYVCIYLYLYIYLYYNFQPGVSTWDLIVTSVIGHLPFVPYAPELNIFKIELNICSRTPPPAIPLQKPIITDSTHPTKLETWDFPLISHSSSALTSKHHSVHTDFTSLGFLTYFLSSPSLLDPAWITGKKISFVLYCLSSYFLYFFKLIFIGV